MDARKGIVWVDREGDQTQLWLDALLLLWWNAWGTKKLTWGSPKKCETNAEFIVDNLLLTDMFRKSWKSASVIRTFEIRLSQPNPRWRNKPRLTPTSNLSLCKLQLSIYPISTSSNFVQLIQNYPKTGWTIQSHHGNEVDIGRTTQSRSPVPCAVNAVNLDHWVFRCRHLSKVSWNGPIKI